MGFEGFAWHTHADVLAATYGIANEAAVKRFVDDLLNNRSIIVILKRGKTVVDIWVTDDPRREVLYSQENESMEFRHWDGTPAGNSESPRGDHVGQYDSVTGEKTDDAIAGRNVEP